MTKEEMEKELARLMAENQAMKEAAVSKITLKVTVPRAAGTNGATDKGSAGGAISVYGLGRFPVTLYKEQWLKVFALADKIKAFITEHEAELSVKGEKAS